MYLSFGKRILDIIVSGVLIVLTLWLFVLIILAYWLSFNFPFFFRQPRLGKGERVFELVKFRTLSKDSIKPFALGTFLRFTSLDELPQLYQVLSGKMSLVGPRPLPVAYQNLFSDEQRRRHDVLPGVTGWAQVNGRHSISWQKKFELDNYYLQHLSLALDIKILVMTLGILFSFKKDVSLTEEKFTGN